MMEAEGLEILFFLSGLELLNVQIVKLRFIEEKGKQY